MALRAKTDRRYLFYFAPVFLILALLLQLFVSLSLPIIKPLYLFSLHIQTSAVEVNKGELRFGLWGFCFLTELDEGWWDYGTCSTPRVGYTVDPAIISTLGLSPYLYDIITQVLVSFLVIHPVVATLTLLSLFPTFFPFSRFAQILSLILNIISAVLSTLVVAVDFAIVMIARNKLQALFPEASTISSLGMRFSLSFGNTVWMSVVAVVALWAAVIAGSIIVCSCIGYIEWDDVDAEQLNKEGKTQFWRKFHFWRHARPRGIRWRRHKPEDVEEKENPSN
ncbi:SubName: Full=Uncharacterized protein {ECO:0000313/EMBL:CCA73442.1} [Serendipita indica DSM 11827]|nr:SubName: Full=Uncharacterized protein {ECO:0000313/EMBL:CCA73442.1} [Serendipita indica DSM 11827]